MQKPKISKRLIALSLVFMLLFTMWNPSMFARGQEGEGGHDGPVIYEDDGSEKEIETPQEGSSGEKVVEEGQEGEEDPKEDEVPKEEIDPDGEGDPEGEEEQEEVDLDEEEEEEEEPIEEDKPGVSIELIPEQDEYSPGDTVFYNILIKNTGNVDLENLHVSDLLKGESIVDFLEIGGEILLEKEFQLAEDFVEDSLYNKVTVSGQYEDREVFAEDEFMLTIIQIEEEDQGLEYFPQVLEPDIEIPSIDFPMARNLIRITSGLQDTIAVSKTAKRTTDEHGNNTGCRTYEVAIKITGTPQNAPVDVVLVIDKSASMNVPTGTNGYYPITQAPANSGNYYVNVDGSYLQISRVSGNGLSSIWSYNIGSSWSPNYRYVTPDLNANNTLPGSTSSSSPVAKQFLIRGNTRLYHAKQAAVNFAYKVLAGPDSVAGSRVSIVSFNGPGTTGQIGSDNNASIDIGLSSSFTDVANKIVAITASNGTNTQAGFNKAKTVIQGSTDKPNSNKVVILFTDGMPTGSNNAGAGPNAPTNENAHTKAAWQAGQAIWNVNPKIADVFTVGLFEAMSGGSLKLAKATLDKAQNKGFYDAATPEALDEIFTEIATKLGYAATNAKVVDVIGDDFNLVEASLPTSGVSLSADKKTITWNPGIIVDVAELKFIVQAKPGFDSGVTSTNESAKLTYKDIVGIDKGPINISVNTVDVPSKLSLALMDATITLGESVNLGNYINPITGGDGNGSYTYEWEKISGSGASWTSSESNPSVSPTEDTQYKLTVTDSNGCRAEATMWVKVGKLTVTIKKEITGNYADLDRKFNFTLWINNVEQPVLILGNDEEKVFEGIGMGSIIKLKEESDGYEVTVKVNGNNEPITAIDGVYTIPVGDKDITIIVTNHKETTVDTGISLDTLPYILVIALAAAGLGFVVIRRRKLRQ